MKAYETLAINLAPGKKIYFASDFHLGVPDKASSIERERRVVRWLDEVAIDAQEIFLLGDVFDFWFEYKAVVPKGYIRLLGKLAELSDKGIKLHYFTGNHDMWVFGYFTEELNIPIYRGPIEREINGQHFYIAHGDGLGPGDHGYKFIKKVFASKISQWLFARLHPNFAFGLANFWSKKSRVANGPKDEKFLGEEKEWLVIHSKEVLQKKHYDYFIYGHRHLPLDIRVGEKSRYINLGEWVNHNSYAEFDGKELFLKRFV